MIHSDMPFIEFLRTLWKNKVKVAAVVLAVIVVPGWFADWRERRDAERLEAARQAIDTEASTTGMLLANAWFACRDIGIVNDLERCAAYEGKLIQEIAAPQLAKMAIQKRSEYHSNCPKLRPPEYCNSLLSRSVQLSVAQHNSRSAN